MSGNDGNGGRMTGPGRDSPDNLDAGVPTDRMGERMEGLSTSFQEEAGFKQTFEVGKWMDISDEEYRIYTFYGIRIMVDEPARLKVSRGDDGQDSHRIVTKKGHGVYIPRGWFSIEWETHEGLDPESF